MLLGHSASGVANKFNCRLLNTRIQLSYSLDGVEVQLVTAKTWLRIHFCGRTPQSKTFSAGQLPATFQFFRRKYGTQI